MNEINLLLAQNEAFRFVQVTFPGSPNKPYTYKTLTPFEPGDTAVVHTPSDGFKCVEVQKVLQLHELETSQHIKYKWIVQKVETTNYNELVDKENEAQALLNTSKTKKLVDELREDLVDRIGEDQVAELQKLTRL